MQTASYTNTQTATGGVGVYPLSTETLEFIQQQVMLLQQMCLICGSKVIVKEPDGTNTGLVAINGELFTMAATPVKNTNTSYINVKTVKQDIVADGETYKEARTIRTASYQTTALSTGTNYSLGDFKALSTNTALAELIRQVPQTVLNYLADTLAGKLDRITVNAATQTTLDSLKTACVVNCTNSVKQCGYTDYCIVVKVMGTTVQQTLTAPNQTTYTRVFSTTWSAWSEKEGNMHIEVKTVGSTVYLRHGVISDDVSIIFLRKKKRSGWRRTGGSKAYTKNQGKREQRLKKLQYVHFKGIVLTKGTPGQWYVPKVKTVFAPGADGSLVGCELSTVANTLIRTGTNTSEGWPVYKVAGVRKLITKGAVANGKRSAYINCGVQICKLNSKGTGKDQGGEMVKMKYRLAPKKIWTDKANGKYTFTYYRSFSVE